MSDRALHEFENVVLTDDSVTSLLTTEPAEDALVVAPEDDRLDYYLAEATGGQTPLSGGDPLPAERFDFHIGDLTSDVTERMPYDDASYDSVVMLYPKLGYFGRMSPFIDLTRVVKPSGTMYCAFGLLPNQDPDHDFKGWVPQSDRLDLEAIYVTRHDGFQTPNVVSEFRREDAQQHRLDTIASEHPNTA